MRKDEDFNSIFQEIFSRRLGQAVKLFENYLLVHPQIGGQDVLQTIKSEYSLLMDYWKKGFADSQRDALFRHLLQRLYVLVADAQLHQSFSRQTVLYACYQRSLTVQRDWTLGNIREQLETYVSDVAMLELEPEHTRQKKSECIYADHQQFMSQLFGYLFSAQQLTEAMGESLKEILLSPTVDVLDQQLMISALTLSCMHIFDPTRFRILLDVYTLATDEDLRQRALVGWVFSLSEGVTEHFPAIVARIHDICSDERYRREITELQIQMIYCMEADNDSRFIKDELMPDLMKGNNLQMGRKGLVEMEEDRLENILHPEAAEESMEKMEAGMRKMADMQRQGSDIYYAGFSQMKRFPFFYDVSNWFVPFYPQHPAVSRIWEESKGKKFLRTITSLGAFCDSDKYSFVLAFSEVLSHIPEQMMKMIENGEASPMAIGGEVSFDEQRVPAFRRRVYLQSLYRFFRLFPRREEFSNPFSRDKVVFFSNPIFKDCSLSATAVEITAFLSKKKMYDEATAVLDIIPEDYRDAEYYLLTASLLVRNAGGDANYQMVCDTYDKALSLLGEQSNVKLRERALRGYARVLFTMERYDEALTAYNSLLAILPDHRHVQLNAAVCMLHLGQYNEALKVLYKLNFEDEQDEAVSRVLAWALTLTGKYEQAEKIYQQLLMQEPKNADDLLNDGYCMWLNKDVAGAVSLFRQYISAVPDGFDHLKEDFQKSAHDLLLKCEISEVEILLMLDAVVA